MFRGSRVCAWCHSRRGYQCRPGENSQRPRMSKFTNLTAFSRTTSLSLESNGQYDVQLVQGLRTTDYQLSERERKRDRPLGVKK
ncbi:unnamed protein product [Caenorhabditis auriculariae]|uniref:Uncharacterized protein n=1 Tax=Caenorhabditis auriculariae TaxID=2777116 RepID=A0A8S1H2R3_9PELO|nr:unnamed protein product [Caenorhabditis auriculariae]